MDKSIYAMTTMTPARLDVPFEFLILYVVVDYFPVGTVEQIRQIRMILFQLFTHL